MIFYHHNEKNLVVGAEAVGGVIDFAYNNGTPYTYFGLEALKQTFDYITNFNTRQLFGSDEIALVRNEDPKMFTMPKFWSRCNDGKCNTLGYTAISNSLNKKTGSIESSDDYQPSRTTSGYTYSEVAQTGIVLKRSRQEIIDKRAIVVGEVLLGMASFMIFGSAIVIFLFWLTLRRLIPHWIDRNKQDEESVGKYAAFKGLYVGAILFVLIVSEVIIMSYTIVHQKKFDVEDQKDLASKNLRIITGMLSKLSETNNASNASTTEQYSTKVADLVNYLNYQILPNGFELLLGTQTQTGLELLSYPKFTTKCNDRVCRTNEGNLRPLGDAIDGKSGSTYMDDYRPEHVLAIYRPLPQLNAGLVLKVDDYKMDKWSMLPDVWGYTFGGWAIFLVGILAIAILGFYKLGVLEARLRPARDPPPLPEEPETGHIWLGACGLVFWVLVLIICLLSVVLVDGYYFMVEQTSNDLDAGVHLAKGILSLQNNASLQQTAKLLDYYNYQVLPKTYEVVMASKKGNDFRYLTQLKFRSGCEDHMCRSDAPGFLADIFNGAKYKIRTSSMDYRPKEVVVSSTKIESGLANNNSDIAIALKVDRKQLKLAWRKRVIRNGAIAGVVFLVLFAVGCFLWAWFMVQSMRKDLDIALRIAKCMAQMDLDDIAFPDKKPPLISSLHDILSHLKAYKATKPFLPGHLLITEHISSIPPGSSLNPVSNELQEVLSTNAQVGDSKDNMKLSSGNKVFPAHSNQLTESVFSQLSLNLRRATILCLQLFSIEDIRRAYGSAIISSVYSELVTEITQIIRERNGIFHGFTLHKWWSYASWNSTINTESFAEKACLASLDIRSKLEVLNATWREKHGFTLKYGIALTTGEIVVGNVGSDNFRELTIMGDAFSIAQPLAALNQMLNSTIIMDEATQSIGCESFQTRVVDIVDFSTFSPVYLTLVHKSRLSVYELMEDMIEKEDLSLNNKPNNLFATGLQQAIRGDITSAGINIRRYMEDTGGVDEVAKVWIARLQNLKQDTPYQPPFYKPGWTYETNNKL
eukprot:NODE_151_length_3450_cov_22.822663_g129_i0.p1 GENE.NODE_151_length_3450_cov_22.822663_g129_i0~~NODE_151_length_3450_cov_22.822663_g129_i0.p1  ORF type:complete len:1123 (+),score=188.65 NODE_151_length_3450_cov_22.822663_g129_i0:268-3369(+)